MKKVLFATTALALSVAYASAEVTLSGDGRMGITFEKNDANFNSRARVKFTLTGETDTGLSFGGDFRVDHEDFGVDDDGNIGQSASQGAAGSVYVTGSYGKLTMGDIDSASEKANGDLYEVGLTNLRDLNEFNYIASSSEYNGNPGAVYEYGFGNATVYVSMYDGTPDHIPAIADDPTTGFDESTRPVGDIAGDAISVGGKYSTDAFTVGLGYEDSSSADINRLTLSGEGTFSGVGLKGIYAHEEHGADFELGAGDLDEYGLAGKYTISSVEVAAFWKRQDDGVNSALDIFGLGGTYDLGGGASIAGGIVDDNGEGTDPRADLGIAFKF